MACLESIAQKTSNIINTCSLILFANWTASRIYNNTQKTSLMELE